MIKLKIHKPSGRWEIDPDPNSNNLDYWHTFTKPELEKMVQKVAAVIDKMGHPLPNPRFGFASMNREFNEGLVPVGLDLQILPFPIYIQTE